MKGVTVKTIIRSHRVAYLVLLLLFAVALSTALLLAGERGAENLKKNPSQIQRNATVAGDLETRFPA
jgi:hypothetical protein